MGRIHTSHISPVTHAIDNLKGLYVRFENTLLKCYITVS